MIKQETIKGVESLTDWIMRTSNTNASYEEDLKVLDDVLEILIEVDSRLIFETINDAVANIVKIAIEKSTTTKSDVFVDYSGHVNNIRVHYYEDGHGKASDPKYFDPVYTVPNEHRSEEEILKQLMDIYDEISALGN